MELTSAPIRSGGGGGHDAVEEATVEKEHMFDKVVTPSDVGKLNRLVIPKQHAERYFPLDAATDGKKGLLLSFEDRAGKPWRFRYSYWNSSQSYVMTKGWSRFVKEKRLDAGDTVSFGRAVGEHARAARLFFIDSRRRPHPPAMACHRLPLSSSVVPFAPWAHGIGAASGTTLIHHLPPSPYDSHHRRHDDAYGPSSRQLLFYRPHQQQATVVLESVPVRIPITTPPGRAELPTSGSKRLRLFGVNLDCAASVEEDGDTRSKPPHQPSPPSSSLLSSPGAGGKARCSWNLDL